MSKRGPPKRKGTRDRNGRLVDQGSPTHERYAHGGIERLEKQISDNDGRPSQPYRAISPLMAMERSGVITPRMFDAGEKFRVRFGVALLDPLHAADLIRAQMSRSTSGTEPSLRVEGARRSVWRAICAIGGLASPAGSCVWNVVGCEQPLKEWALEQGWGGRRDLDRSAASGILIAALGALEEYYR